MNIAALPIARTYNQVLIDPKVIAEYSLPGTIAGYTHLEHMRAAQLE